MNAIINAAIAGSIGMFSIAMAIAFRRGRARRLAFAYWDATMPWYIRNAVFGFAPTGLVLLASAVIVLAVGVGSLTGTFVALPFMLSLGPLLLLVILWARRPSDFLKPEWLRREELARGGQPRGTGVARWIDRMVLLLGVAAAAFVALGLLFYCSSGRADPLKRVLAPHCADRAPRRAKHLAPTEAPEREPAAPNVVS